LEVNSLVVPTGETLQKKPMEPLYSTQRLFKTTDLEVFYFNDTKDPAKNCDDSGPTFLSDPPYHMVDQNTVTWDVPVKDDSGVWRVVVVYNESGKNEWRALELEQKNATEWQGTAVFKGSPRLDYVVQAVDNSGNVSWLDFVPVHPPASGVTP